MEKKLSLILLFATFLGFSQNIKLGGVWILDKTTFADGSHLEVNNNSYSNYSQYKFSNNKMEIEGNEVPVSITSKQIITPSLKINYEFQDKYLLLKSLDKITYLLKPESFLEMYPEFEPKEIRVEDKIAYEENRVVEPYFNYKGGFNRYFTDFWIGQNNLSGKNISIVVQFIITKESKITDLKILKSVSPDIDSKFIQYLKRGEKLFENNLGKDIFIKRKQTFIISDDTRANNMSKEDRNIIKIFDKGNSFYMKNNFEKSIETYEQINTLNLINMDNEILRLLYVNLGVSYLAKDNIAAACENFNKAGGLTDFKSRNYVINFCSKK